MTAESATVEQARYVTLNAQALADDGTLSTLSLNLFPNANYTGEVERVVEDKWGTTWIGGLQGIPDGHFYLTKVEDRVLAHVASPQGIYEASYAGDGLYKVIKIDQARFADHPPGFDSDPTAAASESEPDSDIYISTADTRDRIDILVVYTDDARAAEGGTAAIKARIKLAVDETNNSYAESGVTTQLRLVHVEEMPYAETGNLSTDLSRLRNFSDGYMDRVRVLRNVYGADMVGLIVENGGSYCGLASGIKVGRADAFQVTDRGCATGYYSFGHEFGHLQGARHDVYVDPSVTPFPTGHGYVHPYSTDIADRWRTIMAYNNRCSSWGYNCTRIPRWSNPAKTYNGDPTGDADAKNKNILNKTAYSVANFRKQKIDDGFDSSFNGSHDGWLPVVGVWNQTNFNYQSDGLDNDTVSARHEGNFGDYIYKVRMTRLGDCTSCANRIFVRGNPDIRFSANLWSPSYMFQYTNSGSFSVWEVAGNGSATALAGWTTHAAINQGGANVLKVKAVDKLMKFYINNTLVWAGSDRTLRTGNVGFGFYRDTSAGNKLKVDWAELENAPTADEIMSDDEVAIPGTEMAGGTIDRAP